MIREREVVIRERLRAATPGPWQRSRFVDQPRYARMGPEWKNQAAVQEATVIRGPGVVGSPECNLVAAVHHASSADFDLLVHARGDLEFLLGKLDGLRNRLNGLRKDRDRATAMAVEWRDALRAAQHERGVLYERLAVLEGRWENRLRRTLRRRRNG